MILFVFSERGTMRKSLTMIGVSAATISSLLLASAPSASAATRTYYATESVKLRAKPTTASTALKLVPKGASVKALVDPETGGAKVFSGSKHNACGSKGYVDARWWNKVTYKGTTGYVADPCIILR